MGMSVQILKRHLLDLIKGFLTDIFNNTVYNMVITQAHNPLGCCRKKNHNTHFYKKLPEYIPPVKITVNRLPE